MAAQNNGTCDQETFAIGLNGVNWCNPHPSPSASPFGMTDLVISLSSDNAPCDVIAEVAVESKYTLSSVGSILNIA